MGIYLFLIDSRAPIGAARSVDSTYPGRVYTGNRIFRRLHPSVGGDETIADVVQRVLDGFGPHTLDVIRIFGHGSDRRDPGSSSEATLQFGTGLNSTVVDEFRRIRHLWRRSYVPDIRAHAYGTDVNYRFVIPRIEVHICYATIWGGKVLGALARAACAPVFASGGLQIIAPRNDDLNFEGSVIRYNPF